MTGEIGSTDVQEKRELPDGWRWVKLGDMCDVVSKGTTPSSLGLSYSSEGIPFLRAEDINGTVVDPSKVAFHISSQTNNVLDRSQLFPGDFLITIAGTLGRVGYIADGMPAMNCNQAVAFARPRKDLVSVVYMVYVCQNHDVLAPLLNQRAGGALQNLNLQQVRALRIPLPPLPEQQRIAALLKEQMAAVDKARAAAQERLAAIKALPASFLRQVFPEPDHPLPDGWRWVKLGEVSKVVGGSTPDTGESAYWGNDIAWVTPTDLGKLSSIFIHDTSRKITLVGLMNCGTELVPAGTVVMSSRAPIGHLAIAEQELCTNQGCKSFIPLSQVDSLFLYWSLKKAVPDIQALGSGATFAEVSKSKLQEFEIPLPPLPEQQRIATLLKEQMAAVEKASKAAEAELETINALPASLLRRAFNGEL